MPYSHEHREKIRDKVVQSARLLFNRHGFNGVSIDQIMADAGLTRGGFYSYFKNKTELYAESVTRIVARGRIRVRRIRPLSLQRSQPRWCVIICPVKISRISTGPAR